MIDVGSIIGSREVVVSPPHWTIKDDRSGRTETMTDEPNEEDIKCFNRRISYSSSKVITNDEDAKLIVVRPVDKSG